MSPSDLLWIKVLELYTIRSLLSEKQRGMIELMVEYLDPKNADNELSAKQKKWINWLWLKHFQGRDEW